MLHREGSQLNFLCRQARKLIRRGETLQLREMLCKAMADCPDAAQPHNLMGILLESQGDIPGAMRHYRAACALDPTYRPASYNLDRLGNLFGDQGASPAYDEGCPMGAGRFHHIAYDRSGEGRLASV